MTKKEAKKWLPEITHWANDGILYVYEHIDNTWYIKKGQTFRTNQIYVIKDKHFEARKAFALGEKIEIKTKEDWVISPKPSWLDNVQYRPKPKEPVYDYHFTFRRGDEWFMSLGRWQRLEEAMHFITGKDMTRFEPSKRLKK